MDTAKWPQEFVVKPMNEIVTNTCLKQPDPSASGGPVERKARPEKDQALNCPRCNSLNTKFCYYNNYSLTQPRYFCKDCRRYWTEGGSLRNIPIGGGIRKNKRSSPSSSASSKKALLVSTPPHLNPKTASVPKVQELGFGSAHCEVKDLNLAFSQGFGTGQSIPEFLQVPPSTMKNNTSLVSTSSALELLGISNLRPPFMPTPFPHDPSSGFGLSYPQFQDFMRPAPLGFSLPLHQQEGEGEGEVEVSTTNNGRPLLQFESLNLPVSSSSTNTNSGVNATANDHEHEEGEADQSAGFWNGMLSAGGAAASGSWQ